jgi:hypothetical protein
MNSNERTGGKLARCVFGNSRSVGFTFGSNHHLGDFSHDARYTSPGFPWIYCPSSTC